MSGELWLIAWQPAKAALGRIKPLQAVAAPAKPAAPEGDALPRNPLVNPRQGAALGAPPARFEGD